jgi:hypothetical protein
VSLILPGHLAPRPGAPVGFAATCATVLTEKGARLEVRIFDPRDPFKRQHAVSIDVDTLAPPKPDAPPAPPV